MLSLDPRRKKTEIIMPKQAAEVKDVRPLLLDEYLALKADIEPKEKRLEQIKRLLKDIITRDGPYTDEDRRLVVYLQDRNRTEYDLDGLRRHFPNVARGVVIEVVEPERMKQAIALGEVTESELDATGVRIRHTFARALMVEPIKAARVGSA